MTIEIDLDAIERAAILAEPCPWDRDETAPYGCVKDFRAIATPVVVSELVRRLREAKARIAWQDDAYRELGERMMKAEKDASRLAWLLKYRSAWIWKNVLTDRERDGAVTVLEAIDNAMG